MTSQYATTASQVAAQLHALAQRFEDMGEATFPETMVSLDLQVCQHGGSEQDRVEAVKVLCRGILEIDAMERGAIVGTPVCGIDLDHANIDIYTAVQSAREREMREEIERLRAELAERA